MGCGGHPERHPRTFRLRTCGALGILSESHRTPELHASRLDGALGKGTGSTPRGELSRRANLCRDALESHRGIPNCTRNCPVALQLLAISRRHAKRHVLHVRGAASSATTATNSGVPHYNAVRELFFSTRAGHWESSVNRTVHQSYTRRTLTGASRRNSISSLKQVEQQAGPVSHPFQNGTGQCLPQPADSFWAPEDHETCTLGYLTLLFGSPRLCPSVPVGAPVRKRAEPSLAEATDGPTALPFFGNVRGRPG